MKKILVATALLIGGSLAVAQDLGTPTSKTPFDAYLGPMRSVLSSLGGNHPEVPVVEGYVKVGRGFRYYMKDPLVPQTPQETETSRAGDCKAKSLWVAYKMDDRHVRFVVGRIKSVSNMSHAWLLWKGPAGWLVLDPTFYSKPLEVARLGPGEFTPLFSYSAGGKYKHAGAAGPSKQAESKYGDHS